MPITASWMIEGSKLQKEFNTGFNTVSQNLCYDLGVQPIDAPESICAGSVVKTTSYLDSNITYPIPTCFTREIL